MNDSARRMLRLGTCLMGLGLGACEGAASDPCSESSVAMALQGGVAIDWAGSRATVFLGECSGVLLAPRVIATAAHCVPTERVLDEELPAAHARLAVRGGARGELCLTGGAAGACAELDFDVAVQPAGDVALLVSRRPLAATAFASVALAGETAELRVQGYGIATPAVAATPASACPGFPARQALPDAAAGTQNLSAVLPATQWTAESIYGRAPDDTGVCAGDSGGPAFVARDAGTAIAVGVLASSTPDAARRTCTAAGGLQRWARLDPAFLRGALDGCRDATTASGARVLDCSASSALVGLNAAAPATGARPPELAAALDPAADPDLPAMLFRAGVTIQPGAPSAAANRARAMAAPAGTRVVGAATRLGHYTLYVDEARAGKLFDGGGGGGDGDRSEMIARGLSLSGGVDNRKANFVIQAGAVRSTNASTGKPGCTGALIGRRLARTAAHCINYDGANYFTARYDAGVTTWTFDGGDTFVTFQPVAAQTYYYGGNYFNFDCDTSSRFASTANQEKCAPQDWAILILPSNAWSNIHVVPSYMGYTSPSSLLNVSNTGYPSCSDISSASIPSCVSGKMYGNVNCLIAANHTSFYYTTCDESPGNSGGPTYFDSSGTRYSVGHHIAGPFNGVACSGSGCPSEDCGTDSWFTGFIGDLRDQYNTVSL